jgi:hypothetical protein
MTDIKKLLESIDSMSAAERKPTGPKWPGYWRGKDLAKKSRSRMVGDGGAAESVEEDLEENLRQQFAEYGAPGSAIGNDTAKDPNQEAMLTRQRNAEKGQLRDQIVGLTAQMQGARSQLADMNKSFPQGANPVEKAMSLQQMSAQKVGVQQQIEDLSAQIAALRQQAI